MRLISDQLDVHRTHPRALAYLGDAVYELWIRQQALAQAGLSQQSDALHQFSTKKANAAFQAKLLNEMEVELTETEKEIVRRARNLPLPASRRSQQAQYRQATAFEALVGYLYLTDEERLKNLFKQYLG